MQNNPVNICQEEYRHLQGMRELYRALRVIPTSTEADVILIRSHIAYWSGQDAAARTDIHPSRGHSYKATLLGYTKIIRISDHYDHRDGVSGWVDSTLHCRRIKAI